MDYENITLPSWQLENLLESSDRMRLLCEGRRRGLDFQSSWVDVILGIDLESEKPSWDDCMDILSEENVPEKLVTPEEIVESLEAESDKEPQSPPSDQPKGNGKGTEPVGVGKARKKIDRGKVMALHNAGWKNVKIAEEMGCSEWSVSMIIKEESK